MTPKQTASLINLVARYGTACTLAGEGRVDSKLSEAKYQARIDKVNNLKSKITELIVKL